MATQVDSLLNRVLGYALITFLLAVPVTLFLIGITAKPAGYRFANGYEITNLGYEPEDAVPFYSPDIELARGIFGIAFLLGLPLAVFVATKLDKERRIPK